MRLLGYVRLCSRQKPSGSDADKPDVFRQGLLDRFHLQVRQSMHFHVLSSDVPRCLIRAVARSVDFRFDFFDNIVNVRAYRMSHRASSFIFACAGLNSNFWLFNLVAHFQQSRNKSIFNYNILNVLCQYN